MADEVRQIHTLRRASGLLGDFVRNLALVPGLVRVMHGVGQRKDCAVDGVVLLHLLHLVLVEHAARVRDRRGVGLLRAFGLRLLQCGDCKGAELVERLAALDVFVNHASLHVRRASETVHFADVLGGQSRPCLFILRFVHFWTPCLCGGLFRRCDVHAPRHTHPGISGNGNERCFIGRPRNGTIDGQAVHHVACVLPTIHEIADGHIAPDSGNGVVADFLCAFAAAKLDDAAKFALADGRFANDADLVAAVSVLNHKAVRHPGEVYLASPVPKDFIAVHPLFLVLVIDVSGDGRFRRNGGANLLCGFLAFVGHLKFGGAYAVALVFRNVNLGHRSDLLFEFPFRRYLDFRRSRCFLGRQA